VRDVEPPDAAALQAASEVVRRHLVPTPLKPAPDLGEGAVLKLETFQPTGSFKVRGGLAAVAASIRRRPDQALVTASAGNHGLGVAYAADRLGADATVVVATTASEAKVRALEGYAVTLVRHGSGYDDAEAYALALAENRRGRYVSPYNDPDVIAGQATVGTELLEQLPGLRKVVVPVGGGGLVAGVGLALAGTGVDIVGVEPLTAGAMRASIAAGEAVPVPQHATIADGLAGNIEPGSVTVALAQRSVSAVLGVPEEEIEEAVRYLALEHGLVAEGAGAIGVAAVRSGRVDAGDGPLAVLVTGRNITPELLASVLNPGDARRVATAS
jgi:threonine dehydratase